MSPFSCTGHGWTRPLAAFGGWLGMLAWAGAATNRAPYAESFETYPAGFSVTNLVVWHASDPPRAFVSTNAEALRALEEYAAAGGTFPLSVTHTQVLEAAERVSARLRSPAGHRVRTDFLLRPQLRDDPPLPDATRQGGLYFDAAGVPTVSRRAAEPPGEIWQPLTNAPTIASGQWVRVTFLHDYDHHIYQVSFNGGEPMSDASGWSGPGGTQPGPWFEMPQTNGYLSQVSVSGEQPACVDDFTVVSELPEVWTQWPSNVSAGTGELVGILTFTGLAETAVEVYWGLEDGGTNAAAWAHTNVWPAPQEPQTFSWPVAGLPLLTHHYRYAATNAYGRYWSETGAVLAPYAVWAVTTDTEAGERPPNRGRFAILRPGAATNGSVTVFYRLEGTAENGRDYEALPGVVEIPPGATEAEVLVIPIRDGETEADETVSLLLEPGGYAIAPPAPAPVTIADAPLVTLLWDNGSGDMNWNSSSSNWFGGELFYAGDNVMFNAAGTGRIYVGSATWVPATRSWADATPADVAPGYVTVAAGEYEFEGGTLTSGQVQIRGGRVTDRNLNRTGFGGGALTLAGGQFWRQIPPDTISRTQTLTNALVVTHASVAQGGRGTNYWTGGLDLRARLNIGFTNAVTARQNLFTGPLVVNQDTNATGRRAVVLQVGGGLAFLDGPIVDDPDTNRTAAFPLWLGVGLGASNLTLRGINTYTCGTVVTNFAGAVPVPKAVVVESGSSLGLGPVLVAGTGAVLEVRGSLAVNGDVTVQSGGRLRIAAADALADTSALDLRGNAVVEIGAGLEETVSAFVVGGEKQKPGAYTSADFPSNIAGDGTVVVRGLLSGTLLIVR